MYSNKVHISTPAKKSAAMVKIDMFPSENAGERIKQKTGTNKMTGGAEGGDKKNLNYLISTNTPPFFFCKVDFGSLPIFNPPPQTKTKLSIKKKKKKKKKIGVYVPFLFLLNSGEQTVALVENELEKQPTPREWYLRLS